MQELRNDLTQILKIYTLAKETFEYCFYLHEPDSDLEKEYLSNNTHLKFIRHILWRQTVVEIHKLISDSQNDQFRLRYFLGKLYREMKSPEETGFSLKWKGGLKTHKDAIKHIYKLRDKIYAHTDRDSSEYTNLDLHFEDLRNVLDLIGEIIEDVYGEVFNTKLLRKNLHFNRERFDLVRACWEILKC